MPAAHESPQKGQRSAASGGGVACQSASDGASSATGLSPPDGAGPCARQYDTMYHEDLQVANMVKNHHLAKSIVDAGWSAFLTILSFKAVSPGRRVAAVDPRSRARYALAVA